MESRIDSEVVDFFHVPKHFGNDPSLPFRLSSQIRRRQIDVLHLHNWGTLLEGIAAAKLARVPTLIHGEHGMIYDHPRQIVAQRLAWRAADHLLAVSDALADRMTRVIGFPRERIRVIPNGVDTLRFQPPKGDRRRMKLKLGLPEHGLLVGMVARFVDFKNHAGAIRAMAILRESGVDAHLTLAGRGPLRDDLQGLVNSLRMNANVHFLDELDPIQPLIQCLDVFLSNSTHREGMSNSILEAMACGVPVVATRVAASPQLLDEGEAGVLIPAGDDQALAIALGRLAESDGRRKSLGQIGRRRVETSFSSQRMIEAYEGLYLHSVKRPIRSAPGTDHNVRSERETRIP